MPLVTIPLAPPPTINEMRWAKNGRIPQAVFQNKLARAINFISKRRRKCFFVSHGDLTSLAHSSAGTLPRFAFRCHAGFLARRFKITYMMGRADIAGGADPHMLFTAVPVGGGTTITKEIHFGALDPAVAAPADLFYEFGVGDVFTDDLVADTTYECQISDVDYARTIAVCVYEDAMVNDTANGFIGTSTVVTSPILDEDRQAICELAVNAWDYQGAHILNYVGEATVLPGPATPTNINDGSSTTVSAATPGYTVDLRYKASLGQAGVNVVFAAEGYSSSGSDGEVWLVDSGGSAVLKILSIGTTPGWYTVNGTIPATLAKYDLWAYDPTGSLTITGVSLYEHKV